MGLVIASGMSIGTIFTLFVVPMFYTYIARQPKLASNKPARSPCSAAGLGCRINKKAGHCPAFFDPIRRVVQRALSPSTSMKADSDLNPACSAAIFTASATSAE